VNGGRYGTLPIASILPASAIARQIQGRPADLGQTSARSATIRPCRRLPTWRRTYAGIAMKKKMKKKNKSNKKISITPTAPSRPAAGGHPLGPLRRRPTIAPDRPL
jgi:hypothetical protein